MEWSISPRLPRCKEVNVMTDVIVNNNKEGVWKRELMQQLAGVGHNIHPYFAISYPQVGLGSNFSISAKN